MFFYHIKSECFTWNQWAETQNERKKGFIIVLNMKTNKFKIASPVELLEAGLKDNFTQNQIKNIRFFNHVGDFLHEEYDVRHFLRQAKRMEKLSRYTIILGCGPLTFKEEM